jgi:hypothetical protein
LCLVTPCLPLADSVAMFWISCSISPLQLPRNAIKESAGNAEIQLETSKMLLSKLNELKFRRYLPFRAYSDCSSLHHRKVHLILHYKTDNDCAVHAHFLIASTVFLANPLEESTNASAAQPFPHFLFENVDFPESLHPSLFTLTRILGPGVDYAGADTCRSLHSVFRQLAQGSESTRTGYDPLRELRIYVHNWELSDGATYRERKGCPPKAITRIEPPLTKSTKETRKVEMPLSGVQEFHLLQFPLDLRPYLEKPRTTSLLMMMGSSLANPIIWKEPILMWARVPPRRSRPSET